MEETNLYDNIDKSLEQIEEEVADYFEKNEQEIKEFINFLGEDNQLVC